MSISQLLLILVVALVVLGPQKLPMVAHHIGILVGRLRGYKNQATAFWQQQLKEQKLQENISKAQKADAGYHHDNE